MTATKRMLVKRLVKVRPFRGRGGSFAPSPGGMHPTKVLSKQILAVEIIRSLGCDIAALEVAAVVFEFEVLRGKVALPFVFGAECAFAAVLFEAAAVSFFGGGGGRR